MGRSLRTLVLLLHISSSVGWMGAIASFLALTIMGLTTDEPAVVYGVYVGMYWMGWFVLVPLSFASLLTGSIQSLGTEWGLFRHYWIIAKLLINLLANTVLLLYMFELGSLVAGLATSAGRDAGSSPSPLLHPSSALGLLLTATVLAVYKPRGITPYGWRKQQERRKLRGRQLESPEQERVDGDEQARARHRQSGDLRPQHQPKGRFEDTSRNRQRDRVVTHSPREVLPHLAEGAAADGDRGRDVERIGTHQNHTCRLDRHIGAGSDRDAQVGLGERRGVVDTVADHRHPLSFGL